MDSRIERLIKGEPSEREEILAEAEDDFLREVIEIIMGCKKGYYSVSQQTELKSLDQQHGGVVKRLLSKNIPFHRKEKLLRETGSSFIHKLLKPKQHRRRKDCPVPGCNSLGLLQLHNHLYQVHEYDKSKRNHWLSVARLRKAGINQDAEPCHFIPQ